MEGYVEHSIRRTRGGIIVHHDYDSQAAVFKAVIHWARRLATKWTVAFTWAR